MRHHSAKARTAQAVIAATTTLAGCAADQIQIPFFSTEKTKSATSQEQPSASGQSSSVASQTSGVRPKEISKVTPIASTMLEKNCPVIVQPFKLTDNLASLGLYGATQMFGKLGTPGKLLGGTGSAQAQKKKLSASTKLAAKQLNWLPMSAETLYGEKLHQEDADSVLSRKTASGKKLYPVADKMLQEILSKVGEPHDYEFKLFIRKESSPNALARPGGYIYINKGLIDNPERYPKAYFALAHEVAHVLQRHETMSVQSMAIDSITYEEQLAQIISGVNGNPSLILGQLKVGKNTFTRYHVDQELQSDSCGAKLLARVFPERQELADALNAFLKDLPPPEPEKPLPPPQSDAEKLSRAVHDIVDTPVKRHPNTLERQNNLRAIYNEVAKSMAAKDE